MDVWEIVGYENVEKQSTPGKYNVRLYVQRELPADHNGEGIECSRLYYNPDYVEFVPVIGAKIIAVDGRYGIDKIYRVA